MHMCVCIWWYILQNYKYKLHFQSLSIYHIPHVSIRTLAAENLDVCTTCDPWDSNIQLTMGKDRRHLDLHLEVFVPKEEKEIIENIIVSSGNLKTQNLKTFGSDVSPNSHQRTFAFHERPKSFLGSYSTCSKQHDHPRPYIHGLFDHHGYIWKPDICFLDNHNYQHDARRGFGLISNTHPTLVTTYWKWQFTVPALPPSLSSIGPVTKWNWLGYQPGTLHNIYSTVVGLRSLLLLSLLKKEIVVATTAGWGITKYFQLNWMDDGTDGWMESFTTSINILN